LILGTIAGALAVLLVSTTSVAAITFWDLSSQIQDNAVDISDPDDSTPPQVGEIEGSFNLLVVGVDNDIDQAEAFGERDVTLNDVNILLHVSEDHTTATVVSLPRDLLTSQPECVNVDTGEISPSQRLVSLNSAFARGGNEGGLACVVNTVKDLTGLEIDYAAQMSFNAVVQMTDAVGGVPVCLTEPIVDLYSGLDLPAGTSVISGATALSFLRTRHGVGDGSDLARISSQQVYMSSLVRTLKSDETLTNFTKLYSLANVAATNIRLSTSLAATDTMVSMAQSLRTINLDTMAMVQYPAIDSETYAGKIVPNEPVADALFETIAADQPVLLAEGSTGRGATLDPSVPVTETPAATADPTTPVDPTDPSAVPTADPTDEPIAGLEGQTAQQQTCSVGFGG
jgi:LCP family protein required for cell wall assembly